MVNVIIDILGLNQGEILERVCSGMYLQKTVVTIFSASLHSKPTDWRPGNEPWEYWGMFTFLKTVLRPVCHFSHCTVNLNEGHWPNASRIPLLELETGLEGELGRTWRGVFTLNDPGSQL